jgi:hypothetical protein
MRYLAVSYHARPINKNSGKDTAASHLDCLAQRQMSHVVVQFKFPGHLVDHIASVDRQRLVVDNTILVLNILLVVWMA